ncbi:transposable element Tcb1 transposase [Trichonephila clavipes]|nr:transposable element Tcb1 transposase [Trichonephila clavipes]
MARIVRHNDKSVREWWQRSEIVHKSFQSLSVNKRIVMTQRKHLDDFLRGRIFGRLECGRIQLELSENLESARVSSPGYDNYYKMMHSIKPVLSALFSYRYDSFKADRVQTLRAHWSICSPSGIRYHQENTIERHRYGGAGWLVWGGIILGSITDLRVLSVTMIGHIYWDVILEQHVRLFRVAMGTEFLLIYDNARPHHANIVECLQSKDITRMD